MSKLAARVGDLHACPMVTPGTPPIPHVGGPITGPGVPTVFICGMPAATMGDMCTCVGPPDTIVLGSVGVFIGGKPAARMGDMCAHGGSIMTGAPTVMIGEISPNASPPSPVVVQMLADLKAKMDKPGLVTSDSTKAAIQNAKTTVAMQKAAQEGVGFVEICKG